MFRLIARLPTVVVIVATTTVSFSWTTIPSLSLIGFSRRIKSQKRIQLVWVTGRAVTPQITYMIVSWRYKLIGALRNTRFILDSAAI